MPSSCESSRRSANATALARPHYLSRAVIEGVHLFRASPTRRWAMARGGSSCRSAAFIERAGTTAALVDLHVDRPVRQRALVRSSGSALLRSCAALEGVLPLLHRRPPAAPDRRVPAAERRVPALGPVCGGAGRIVAQDDRAAHRPRRRRPHRAAGRPPPRVARLRPGGRDPRRHPHAYLDGITRHAAQIHAAVYQSYVMYPIESALPA